MSGSRSRCRKDLDATSSSSQGKAKREQQRKTTDEAESSSYLSCERQCDYGDHWHQGRGHCSEYVDGTTDELLSVQRVVT